jgi:hypothetical protein
MNIRLLVLVLAGAAVIVQGAASAQNPTGPQDCTPVPAGCFKPTLPKECSDYEKTPTGACIHILCRYQQVFPPGAPEGMWLNLGCAHQVSTQLVGPELFYLSRVRYTNPSVAGEAPENGFDKVNCTKTHCLILQECFGCEDYLTQLKCETHEDYPEFSGPKTYTNMVPAGNYCVAGNANVPNHPQSGTPVPAPEDSPGQVGGPGE